MRLIIILGILLLLTACVQEINSIKNEDMIGEEVAVRGTVKNTIKIGPLSGYTLEDESGSIGVSSETLPVEGTEMTVKGVLIKDTLFGYYIKV